LVILSLLACDPSNRQTDWDGEALAEVYGRVLTASDLEEKNIDLEQDSALLWTLYVDQWIRDELFFLKAEEQLKDISEIEKLVSSYRQSLMIHYYEQQLIQEQLDSIISEEEIVQHYEGRKDNFILNEAVVQARWIITQSSNFKADTVSAHWSSETHKDDRLKALCELYSRSYNLNDSLWLSFRELSSRTGLSLEDLRKLRLEEFHEIPQNEGVRLMIQMNSIVEEGSVAPVQYVKERIRRIILHDRKEEILKSYRQRIYQKAIQERKVKMYIQ